MWVQLGALVLAVCIFVACGRDDRDVSEPTQVDALLAVAFNDFLEQCYVRGLSNGSVPMPRSIAFGEPGEGNDATCFRPSRRVVLSKRFRNATPVEVRAVLWHELAHCMYDVGHEDEEGHIMSSATSQEQFYNWRAEVDRFFEYVKTNSPYTR